MAGEGKEIYSLARQTVVGRVYCFFNHNLLLGHLLCKGCVVCVVIPIYTIVAITSYLARLHPPETIRECVILIVLSTCWIGSKERQGAKDRTPGS